MEYLDNTEIRTRRRNAPILKSFRSNYTVVDRCSYLQTARVWNNLETDIRNTDNIEAFKSVQKKCLSEQIPPLIP